MSCSLHYATQTFFRRYTWLVVSWGTETAWVMASVINSGIAHNHPLLYTFRPISICLVLCRNHLRENPKKVSISITGQLAATAKIRSVTFEIIETLLAQMRRSMKYCVSLHCSRIYMPHSWKIATSHKYGNYDHLQCKHSNLLQYPVQEKNIRKEHPSQILLNLSSI